jgi:hypothetical protein
MLIFLFFINSLVFSYLDISDKKICSYNPIEISFYPLNNYKVDFRLVRPSVQDRTIQLCIPAAFTSQDNKPEGLIFLNGVNKYKYRSTNGSGALFISLGECEILSIEAANDLAQNPKNNFFSLFQQYQLIRNGRSYENPFSKRKLQMRVIAFLNKKIFIIESKNQVESEKFITHLLDIGVTEALYLDMGSWSEGWYRSENDVIVKIGLNRQNTHRQTNWLLFHR